MTENTPTEYPTVSTKKSLVFVPILIGLLIVVGLVSGAFYLGKSMSPQQSVSTEKTPLGAEKTLLGSEAEKVPAAAASQDSNGFPAVSEKGPQSFPVLTENSLVWVPLQNPEQKNTAYTKKFNGEGGTSGKGSTPLLVAPDLLKAAVITTGGELEIVSSDGTFVTPFPGLEVQYLTTWSMDSQKLIVYVSSPTIKSVLLPEGMTQSDPTQSVQKVSPNNQPNGFYEVDLKKKKVLYLPALSDIEVEKFVDDSNLLVTVPGFNYKDHYALYNIVQNTVDPTKLYSLLDDYFAPQFSTSRDGKTWALTLSPTDKVNGENSEARITLGTYPDSIIGKTIKSGRFAQVQGPIVSPLGTKVIFRAYDLVNSPHYIHLYQDGKEERLFEGLAKMWANDTQFVYEKYSSSYTSRENLQNISLYDTNTKQSTVLYTFPAKKDK